MMSVPSLKCGYCNFILHGSCGNALAHHCFSSFDEAIHAINVDENSVVTMVQKYDSGAEQMEDAHEAIIGVASSLMQIDELLIDLVRDRKGLWDSRLHVKERTKLKRDSLWNEIVNALEGALTIKLVKQKWKHLRDSYMKARKRMQGYVRSGSGAEAGHPLKSTFAYYEKMRFLDDTLNTMPTVNSVQHLVDDLTQSSSSSSSSNVYAEAELFDISMKDGNKTEETSDTDRSESMALSTARANSKKRKAEKQTQLQDAFLEMLKVTPHKERDVVDNFVDLLADILRRLPYPKRRSLQKSIMDMAIITEETEEAQNAKKLD